MPVVHASRSPLVATVVMDVLGDHLAVAAIGSSAQVSRVAVLWLVPDAT
jgi:hypothetical protein